MGETCSTSATEMHTKCSWKTGRRETLEKPGCKLETYVFSSFFSSCHSFYFWLIDFLAESERCQAKHLIYFLPAKRGKKVSGRDEETDPAVDDSVLGLGMCGSTG
jgi:hypothetical protein